MDAGDLYGAATLTGGFLGLVVVAEALRTRAGVAPEHTRKLVHLGGGAGCLALPFLVRSPWVVLAMAAGMSGLFALGAWRGWLASLHGVGRRSRGAEYYPIAIFLVYLMAGDEPAYYVSAVLVLAVADAFAALVGMRYGRLRYEVEEGHKSLEGSAVFLLLAFLAIHLPLLLLTDLDRGHAVLSALLVASLVTVFEAVSLEGADNLFVPIGVAVCLQKICSKPVGEAVFQNLSLLGVGLVVGLAAWRARWFNVGATLVVLLYAYGAWALCNWLWSVPLVVALVTSLVVGLRAGRRGHHVVKVRYMAGALLPPFVLVAVGNVAPDQDRYYGPYLATLTAVMVFWVRSRSRRFSGGATRGGLTAALALATWLVVAGPPWLLAPPREARLLLAPGLSALLVVLGEAWWGARAGDGPDPPAGRWGARRFLAALAAGALVLLAESAGLVGSWKPSLAPGNPQRLFWDRPAAPRAGERPGG